MIKYCACCRTPYHPEFEDLYCPRLGCGAKLIEIDEAMYAIIDFLSSKRVQTVFSCSGHAYEDYTNQYIMFEGDLSSTIMQHHIPAGFKFTVDVFEYDEENPCTDQFGQSSWGKIYRTTVYAPHHEIKRYRNRMMLQAAIDKDLASFSKWICEAFG